MSRKLVLASALATFLATGAQASSSVVVNLTHLDATATGAFAWLDLGHSFTALAQDQTGWATDSTPTWSGWTADYSYGAAATVTTSAGTTASAGATANGYSFMVSTPTTGGTAVSSLDLWGNFSLAAHSSVTISWDRSALGTNMGAAANTMVFTNSMVLNMSGLINDEWHGLTPLYAAQSIQNPSAFSFSGNDHQSFTFTNSSDDVQINSFRTSVQVYTLDAVPTTTSVPEPEGYALALAGLATVGFVTIRRRRG